MCEEQDSNLYQQKKSTFYQLNYLRNLGVVWESKINFLVFINMKPLFDINNLDKFDPHEKLPLECETCGNTFFSIKKEVRKVLNSHKAVKLKNCSKKCAGLQRTKTKTFFCTNCNVKITKSPSEIKKVKNVFCSQSCAATYNNKHKTHGTRRSKLEIWLEDQLNNLYPNLDILFNNKETIKSELDIYIPSMKLAFELNGIFHYEPIFGEDKLQKIQENDSNKFQACQKQSISICSIDTSSQKYFKPKTSKKYLDIITTIINQRTFS